LSSVKAAVIITVRATADAMIDERAIEVLLETVSEAVWIVAPALEVLRANAPFAALRISMHDAWWRDLCGRVLAGRSVAAPARIGERMYSVTANPLRGENGAIDAAVFCAREVVETRVERDDLLELAVTRLFESDKPLDATLADVLEFLCESDGWDHGALRIGGDDAPTATWTRADADVDLTSAPATVLLRAADRVVGALELRPARVGHPRALERAGGSLARLIERRRLLEAIERKGQEWSLTFDAIELPIFITRVDGTIARVNRAARDLAGGDFIAVVGHNIAMTESEPWRTLADIVVAVRDSRTSCTAQLTEAARTWDVSASWFYSASDDDDRVIVVMRDVTTVIQLQESVRRGEQLAALGELVAGVAHEVRNPIFGMGLTVDALQSMLPDEPDFNELAGVLRTWLDRLNRLMESLLEYGRTWTLELRRGDLGDVLLPVVEGCRQIAAQSLVAIETSIDPDLAMLLDPSRITHAIENLLTNAIQHSKAGERVVISARTLRTGGSDVVECAVRDHGPGFDPFDLPRVFQPFFTRRRGGTGLGLSIVQRIVDEHGGTVSAGNADGGGAVVMMRFPAWREWPTNRTTNAT
jgi:signal transduction histidine kinase